MKELSLQCITKGQVYKHLQLQTSEGCCGYTAPLCCWESLAPKRACYGWGRFQETAGGSLFLYAPFFFMLLKNPSPLPTKCAGTVGCSFQWQISSSCASAKLTGPCRRDLCEQWDLHSLTAVMSQDSPGNANMFSLCSLQ